MIVSLNTIDFKKSVGVKLRRDVGVEILRRTRIRKIRKMKKNSKIVQMDSTS